VGALNAYSDGDADEDDQPVEPGGEGEGDEPATPGGREILRPGVDWRGRSASATRRNRPCAAGCDHSSDVPGNTGFRAILRLSQGLLGADGRHATPREIDQLPGAYLFLEWLHSATTNVDVGDPSRLSVSCPDCGGAFLPMMPTNA